MTEFLACLPEILVGLVAWLFVHGLVHLLELFDFRMQPATEWP